MSTNIIILCIGVLVFSAHLFAKLFVHTRIPDVLPLMIIGIIVGPLLGWITPTDFGVVGNIFIILALIIILFESGMDIDLAALAKAAAGSVKLTLINFISTVIVVAVFSIIFLNYSLPFGIMIGAIVGGTSSAVVIPMVQRLTLSDRTRTALILESTFSDVLCIVVTIGMIEGIKFNNINFSLMLGQILASFMLAIIIGALTAFIWSSALIKIRRLEYNIFSTQAFVFIVYGITQMLGYSGAIAALAFGFSIANMKNFNLKIINNRFQTLNLSKKEKAFSDELAFLIKTFLFVYIGISIRFNDFWGILVGLILTAIVFTLRIIVIRLSFDSDICSKSDAIIAAVMTPKGLAAAVLASMPLSFGLHRAEFIQNIVYSMVFFSIVSTALLIFLIEKNILKKKYQLWFYNYKETIE